MRVKFLPANQAWILMLGDTIIDLDGQRIFTDLDDLKWVLRLKGLRIFRGLVKPIGHPFRAE